MSLLPSLSFGLAGAAAPRRSLWKMLTRAVLLAVGCLLMGVGLIIVLRTSRPARRQFVGLQRRHPKLVFPLRRLLRREPEVMPVAWQQLLRAEKLVLPKKWRHAARLRRRYLRKPRSV